MIDARTQMGSVFLTVADLDRSLHYYGDNIGLRLHDRQDGRACLGNGADDLLMLTEQPGARPARGKSGLYHFALLLPSRLDLACTLQHLADTGTPIGGASDHAVSEAIYLTDPDGHGIEIYRDRPRSEWEYPDGNLKLTVDPFDGAGVMAELEGSEPSWSGLAAGTVMGHVHLHVAYLDQAVDFYTDVLGFELMASYGEEAAFVAAGGYHHHLGLNTWAGVGAPAPGRDDASLQWYEIRLPDQGALTEVVGRLEAAGVKRTATEGAWLVHDPSGNGLMLRTL